MIVNGMILVYLDDILDLVFDDADYLVTKMYSHTLILPHTIIQLINGMLVLV